MGVHRVGRGLLVTVGRGDGAVGRLVHLWRHGGGVLMSRHVRQTRRHRHLHVYNEKSKQYVNSKLDLEFGLELGHHQEILRIVYYDAAFCGFKDRKANVLFSATA